MGGVFLLEVQEQGCERGARGGEASGTGKVGSDPVRTACVEVAW